MAKIYNTYCNAGVRRAGAFRKFLYGFYFIVLRKVSCKKPCAYFKACNCIRIRRLLCGRVYVQDGCVLFKEQTALHCQQSQTLKADTTAEVREIIEEIEW